MSVFPRMSTQQSNAESYLGGCELWIGTYFQILAQVCISCVALVQVADPSDFALPICETGPCRLPWKAVWITDDVYMVSPIHLVSYKQPCDSPLHLE